MYNVPASCIYFWTSDVDYWILQALANWESSASALGSDATAVFKARHIVIAFETAQLCPSIKPCLGDGNKIRLAEKAQQSIDFRHIDLSQKMLQDTIQREDDEQAWYIAAVRYCDITKC